jgi:hypothetical protein
MTLRFVDHKHDYNHVNCRHAALPCTCAAISSQGEAKR